MKIVNELVMDKFRAKSHCEFCGEKLHCRAEPHHILGRGFGGGSRMDVEINLIALGGPWDCGCHEQAQRYKIPRDDILAVVARRERLTPDELLCKLYRLQRRTR